MDFFATWQAAPYMKRNKFVLISRPRHDAITNYLCAWSEDIVIQAKKKATGVYDLKGEKATRVQLESYIDKHKPSFVFLNGHGNAHIIAGHDDRPLVDTSSALKGMILYARSCDAGQVLGPLLVEKGAAAFIGYTRKFTFGYLPEKMARPREDTLAALFLEPSNLVPSTLLKGHTTEEAHRRSKDAMYRNFRRMIASVATYEERYAARWLWANINSQVLLGDSTKRV